MHEKDKKTGGVIRLERGRIHTIDAGNIRQYILQLMQPPALLALENNLLERKVLRDLLARTSHTHGAISPPWDILEALIFP